MTKPRLDGNKSRFINGELLELIEQAIEKTFDIRVENLARNHEAVENIAESLMQDERKMRSVVALMKEGKYQEAEELILKGFKR